MNKAKPLEFGIPYVSSVLNTVSVHYCLQILMSHSRLDEQCLDCSDCQCEVFTKL